MALAIALGCGSAAGAGWEREDPLAMLSGRAQASQRLMSEAEWAAALVDAFGLSAALTGKGADAERFTLLCPVRAERITESGGRQVPGRAALRVAVSPDSRGPGEPVRFVVHAPGSALYTLSLEGAGSQRWRVDGHLVGHLDPSPLGVVQAPRLLPLARGPHELAAQLAPLARVDRVELAAKRSLCIAPADGWHAERSLSYGTLARTLVHALDLEKDLPVIGRGIPVPGAGFSEVSGGGERSERRLENGPLAPVWARASQGPAEFVYRVRLEDPGLFSLTARLPGGGSQIWSVDGRYRAQLAPAGAASRFEWNHVLTLPLSAGEHVVRVFASGGSGVDRIRLLPHRSTDAHYVALLARSGFAEGAPDERVTRSVALESLTERRLVDAARGLLGRYAAGSTRPPAAAVDPPHPVVRPPAAPARGFRPEVWR